MLVNWFWKLLATLSYLIYISAIVAFLVVADNHLLNTWPDFLKPKIHVLIIASIFKFIIAFIVAEAVSQMEELYVLHNIQVFQAARLGPWGAKQFVAKIQRTRAMLASPCGLLIIATILFDPGVPSVLAFDTGPVQVFNVASDF